MEKEKKIREWILDLPKKGKITFSLDEVNALFPHVTQSNKRVTLWRLVEARKIQSVWKGFYIVIPIEYELKGSVPPIVYINQLMTYLNREYYIGLLNAAAFYGASHQQPQELTVITDKGNYRDKHKNGVKINSADLAKSGREIERTVYAFIARQVLGDSAFYQIYQESDPVINKAVEIITSGKKLEDL